VLFVPFFLLAEKRNSKLGALLSLLKAVALGGAACVGFYVLVSPNPYSVMSRFLLLASSSLSDGMGFLFQHVHLNLMNFLFYYGHPLEILQRYQVILLMVATGGLTIAVGVKNRVFSDKRLGSFWNPGKDAVFHLYNLGSIVLFSVAFYDIHSWRDYRTFAPHLLLTILLLIERGRKNWRSCLVTLIIFGNIILCPMFLDVFKEFRSHNFQYDASRIESFRFVVHRLLVYDRESSPWCNTLLTSTFPPELTALTAGFGFSAVFDWNRIKFPLKSRYILLTSEDRSMLGNRADLELLSTTPIGNIYLNLDSGCNETGSR